MTPSPATSIGLNPGVLVALILGSLCASGGTLLLKIGATGNTSLLDFANLRVAGGLGFYGLGSALWIFAMARAPLSIVYPFNALSMALVLLASMVLLGEQPTSTTIGGSILILSGICCIAFGQLA